MAFLPVLCLILTLALYLGAKRLHRRVNRWWSTPILLVPVLLVLVLLGFGVPYATYATDTRWLVWLLGPATVAFAVPIYEQRALIRRQWPVLLVGVSVGVVVGVVASVGLARLLSLPELLQRSLAVKSISTPFALAASATLGGDPSLTAIFVVVTGVLGMSLGEMLLVALKLRSRMACGVLFGAAAHGAGTAKAQEIGSEEGVIASLTMMLCGVATVLVAPLLNAVL